MLNVYKAITLPLEFSVCGNVSEGSMVSNTKQNDAQERWEVLLAGRYKGSNGV